MATFDNYLRCVDYQGHEAAPNYPGFTQFFKEDTGMWYFAMVSASGKVLLKSEAYASEAGRNNGIESVNRNRDIAERFSVSNDDGHWRAILKAGNRQEIARSCGFDTEAEAQAHIATCDSTYVEPVAVAAMAAKDTISAPKVLDNYLDCDVYSNNPDLPQTGFSGFFDDERQNWFFAVHDRAGRVLLRSEGYTSEAGRANGVESVIKNRDNRDRYKVKGYPDGRWVVSLVAGNNQEIARSCPFYSEAEATAWIDDCLKWDYVAPVAAAALAAKETVAAPRVIEDYLDCEAYSNHPDLPQTGFSGFFDETNQNWFFAVHDRAGRVLLRSEGYTAEAGRANGVESVIKNRDNRDRYKVKNYPDGTWMVSLVAGNNQEIARSCPFQSEAAAAAWIDDCMKWNYVEPVAAVVAPIIEAPKVEIPVVVAAAAAPLVVEKLVEFKKEEPKVEIPVAPIIAAAPIIVKKVVETVQEKKAEPVKPAYVPPVKTKVEAAYVPKPAPIVVPPVVEEEAGGCMKYWWLLPLLLALGALLWWLTKDGCGKKAEIPVPKVEIPTAAAPVIETPKPVAPVCNCTGNTDPLFNIPTDVTPKSLTRLGTCPEFGNSHGLSGAEFYAKLAKRATASKVDRLFLDRVFKGMGYTGFVDAKPEMFSEVEIPAGTAGNMGYAVSHKTAYDRLDATGKDLLAFRIKSANGCDMHFMKTCGNHFFFCPR